MGAEGAYIPLIAAAIGAGGGIGTALLTPSAQEHQSFSGTAFDPTYVNTEALNGIRGALTNALDRALRSPDLSNAVVGDMPTFTGGGLPMPIGVSGKPPTRLTPGNTGTVPSPYPAGGDPIKTGPFPGPKTGPYPGPSDPGPPTPDPNAPIVTFPPPPGGGGAHTPGHTPLPSVPDPAPTPASSFLSSGPKRNAPQGFGAASGAGATPQIPQLDPQARGAVQLLLQSIQGMGGGGRAGAGGYG